MGNDLAIEKVLDELKSYLNFRAHVSRFASGRKLGKNLYLVNYKSCYVLLLVNIAV